VFLTNYPGRIPALRVHLRLSRGCSLVVWFGDVSLVPAGVHRVSTRRVAAGPVISNKRRVVRVLTMFDLILLTHERTCFSETDFPG
jgi:hypothetical protein